jgi:mannose-6-phosphate isomerase-like protein (cupin superfamily)
MPSPGAQTFRPSLAALFAVGACTGCAQPPRVLLPSPPRSTAVEELLGAAPLSAGENIRATEIARGTSASLHLVRIRDREMPHVHERYDLTVTLLDGKGTLWLDGSALAMRPGDVAFVPRGTPHYFVNEGREPAAAIVSFSPAFDGPDQEAPGS